MCTKLFLCLFGQYHKYVYDQQCIFSNTFNFNFLEQLNRPSFHQARATNTAHTLYIAFPIL